MTDIVEKLRARAAQEHEMLGDIHIPLLEAADEIERLQAGIADMRHTIDQFGREDANKVAEIRRTRIWALEKVISKKVAQIRRMQAAMLDALLLLSEMGLSADEKCEAAHDRLRETYDAYSELGEKA